MSSPTSVDEDFLLAYYSYWQADPIFWPLSRGCLQVKILPGKHAHAAGKRKSDGFLCPLRLSRSNLRASVQGMLPTVVLF